MLPYFEQQNGDDMYKNQVKFKTEKPYSKRQMLNFDAQAQIDAGNK